MGKDYSELLQSVQTDLPAFDAEKIEMVIRPLPLQ